MSANDPKSESSLVTQALADLQERLPTGWKIERGPVEAGGELSPADAKVTLTGPNRTGTTIAVEARQAVSPRSVMDLLPILETARKMGAYYPLLVIAPWLSKRSQELLAKAGINYLDLTGNALLRIDNPPFYLQTTGAERNPTPKPRGQAKLSGAKAGRLIRLLADASPPYGVRELARAAGLAPGYVSRMLDTLYRDALVERTGNGGIESVDFVALLRRWARSYAVFKSNEVEGFVAPKGAELFLEGLAEDEGSGTQIAITGSFAARRLAPVASPSLLLAYCDFPEDLASRFNLLPASEGADVILLRRFDPVVFERTTIEEGLRYASPSQVAVDCLTGNGRMPAEGEMLLDWMQANEATWRESKLQELTP
jgi:DNA-binding MarR family transcriptional regulator